MAADLGQDDELFGHREKVLEAGASKAFIEDLRHEFVTRYLWPLVKAGARYEGTYLLGSSIAQPVIAKRQVEIAIQEDADAVVQACTSVVGDQAGFEHTYKALGPELKILALPAQPAQPALNSVRCCDANLWHFSHKGGILEDLAEAPPQNLFESTLDPRSCPDGESEITIDFEHGTPVGLNGRNIPPIQLLESLNEIGGTNGIGRVDFVERRASGMKSRGIYETPGGTLIMAAHRELESLCLDRPTRYHKDILSITYAQLVYDGQWFTPLREALDAFIEKTQQRVSGSVTLGPYKGNLTVKARMSFDTHREKYETLARTV
jgi:argininosuccinate synthase